VTAEAVLAGSRRPAAQVPVRQIDIADAVRR